MALHKGLEAIGLGLGTNGYGIGRSHAFPYDLRQSRGSSPDRRAFYLFRRPRSARALHRRPSRLAGVRLLS